MSAKMMKNLRWILLGLFLLAWIGVVWAGGIGIGLGVRLGAGTGAVGSGDAVLWDAGGDAVLWDASGDAVQWN